jgi:putative ABC transport system permease protein
LIARQDVWLIFVGEVVGIGIAMGLNRAMRTLVFGVTTTDTMTYATMAGLFAAVALLACYVPGRRATRIDPMTALRCE